MAGAEASRIAVDAVLEHLNAADTLDAQHLGTPLAKAIKPLSMSVRLKRCNRRWAVPS